MNNFDAYVTNIVYGLFLLVGYNFCGIIPTILALVAGVLVAIISSLILKKVLFGQ